MTVKLRLSAEPGIALIVSPHRQSIVDCVIEAIQTLGFPSRPRMDVATTSFAPGG